MSLWWPEDGAMLINRPVYQCATLLVGWYLIEHRTLQQNILQGHMLNPLLAYTIYSVGAFLFCALSIIIDFYV